LGIARDDEGHRGAPGIYLARIATGSVTRTASVVILE
jgi:hypothetical protein